MRIGLASFPANPPFRTYRKEVASVSGPMGKVRMAQVKSCLSAKLASFFSQSDTHTHTQAHTIPTILRSIEDKAFFFFSNRQQQCPRNRVPAYSAS